MVSRLFRFIEREISGLHEAAYLLASCAILSQLLALIRDRLFASTFGAGHTLDIYYAAFRIPDLIFVSVASLVSISVLVPFITQKMKEGEEQGKRFIDDIFSLFFVLIVVVCVLMFFLMPLLVPKVFPGFAADPELPSLILLARILLLSPLLLGISNFFASITQMYNRFLLYAVSPLLYNLGIIIGALFLYPKFGIAGLGFGVVLGALLHLGIQIPFIMKQDLFPRLCVPRHWKPLLRAASLSLPRTLTLSANQIATFFLVAIGSYFAAGSIAVFNFAWNLQSVPLSIIGASYASAAFPALSRLVVEKRIGEFVAQVALSARHILFWSLPMLSLFIVLRAQIVRTILGAGAFSWSDTRLTAACLAIFIVSTAAQSLLLLFVRGYYALGKTGKPLLINVLSSALIVGFAYVLLRLFGAVPVVQYFLESLFKVENLSGSVVLILPLAYTLGTLLNALWHWIAFGQEFKGFNSSVLRTLFQSLSASVIMGYVAYLFLNVFDDLLDVHTALGIFLQGLYSGLIGIAVGVLVLHILKSEELADVWKTLHHKIWKAKVIGPEPTETTL
ncbi:MAG: lipid II flippase MurJ [bacterium]|nr:lipid II flippase MurJ [bacterium]